MSSTVERITAGPAQPINAPEILVLTPDMVAPPCEYKPLEFPQPFSVHPQEDETALHIHGLSPVAAKFTTSLAQGGQLPRVLDYIVGLGYAQSPEEAMGVINSLAVKYPTVIPVTTADLENRVRLQTKKALTTGDIVTAERNGKVIQRHGSISHVVIPQIYSGDFSEPKRKDVYYQSSLMNGDLLGDVPVPKPFVNGRVQEEYVSELFDTWVEIMDQLDGNSELSSLADRITDNQSVQKLKRLLLAAFPQETQEISTLTQEGLPDYLPLMTYMTWANTLFCQYGRPPRALFKEKQVLHTPTHRVTGGRIDAVEVTQINDQTPDPEQVEWLQQMTSNKYSSIGILVNDVVKSFGRNVDFGILDWKFAVGDSPAQDRIITLGELGEPFPSHLKQIILRVHGSCISIHYLIEDL